MNQQNKFDYLISKGDDYINITPSSIQKSFSNMQLSRKLNQYFTDPTNPTRNEMVLFELEHGYIYEEVIEMYNIINDNFKG